MTKPSWHLDNAEERAQRSKYTFYKPSQAIINKLAPGNICKLIFNFESGDPEHPSAERMWVKIESINHGIFTGHLDNQPYYIKDLYLGDPIEFEARHIIDLDIEDDDPKLVDKYLDRCIISKRIIYEQKKIGYLYRDEPLDKGINDYKDSGWCFTEGDETQGFLEDPENCQMVSLGAILNNDDSFIHLLDAPFGSAFFRDKGSGEFVKES